MSSSEIDNDYNFKILTATIQFIKSTQRFQQLFIERLSFFYFFIFKFMGQSFWFTPSYFQRSREQ